MKPSTRTLAVAAAALAAACGSDIAEVSRLGGGTVVTYLAPGPPAPGRTTFSIVSAAGYVPADATSGATTVDVPAIVARVAADLAARGFVRNADTVPDSPPPSPPADLAVNVTVLEGSAAAPGAWTKAPGHLDPAAWGLAGAAWTYPWTWAPVSASGAALLVEIGDLGGASATEVRVVWAAYVPDPFPPGGPYGSLSTLAAIDQAFAQSPSVVPGGLP